MMSVTCPGCGAALQLSEQVAGLPVRCPHCRHEFTVPDTVPELEPAVESNPSAAASLPAPWPTETTERIERPRRPARKRRSVLLTCGIIAGVVLLACGGVGTLFYFFFIHETEEPIVAADRGVVITAERLKEFVPTLHFDPQRGTLRKVRHLDGSREVTYEYESADGEESSLYINDQVGIERSVQSARGAYGGLGIGTNIGLRLQGEGELRQLDRNDLWRWGEDSKCILLMNGDKKVGNLFMARKGRRYFSLMIIGVYFEHAEPIHELLDPMLRCLDNYDG